jgi:hypothetical protein
MKTISFATLLTLCSCGLGNTCDNEIVKEIYSSDKKYKAVIFRRDCGATTGTSSQLSILKAEKELENQGGNTFAIDKGEIKEVKWQNLRQLTVHYDSIARTFEKKEIVEDISVKYEIK